MALIKCPKCGKDISDKAKKCPHCNEVTNNLKKGSKTKLFILVGSIVVIIIVGVILFFVLNNEESNSFSNSEFEASYPNGVSVKQDSKNTYLYYYEEGKDIRSYVMIYHFEKYTDPEKCLNDLTESMGKDHKNFKSNKTDEKKISGIEFYHTTYTYDVDNVKITDNRYAKVYDGTVWMFTTREEDNVDLSKVLEKVVKSFKVIK